MKVNVLFTFATSRIELGRCTDTSDLRHFGPKTFWHHVFGAEVSQIFCTGAEVSIGHFGTNYRVVELLLILYIDLVLLNKQLLPRNRHGK